MFNTKKEIEKRIKKIEDDVYIYAHEFVFGGWTIGEEKKFSRIENLEDKVKKLEKINNLLLEKLNLKVEEVEATESHLILKSKKSK